MKNWNLPIALTWLRIILIPVFTLLFFLPYREVDPHWLDWLAAAIFALAAITDWFDGFLARRWQQTSDFGAFLDPVADKLMVAAALILLVYLDRTSPIAAMIIIGREITISALREWMAQAGKRNSIAVATIGKFKTAAQMVAIILLLIDRIPSLGLDFLFLGNVLMVIACILTLWSMFHYLLLAAREFRR
ncbi:MAG: CDP-diacylglycerol--glycerol-3-phosphate 3-phosphatidyltransferase [Neisseria sp.]|nr:CDP-diacylglycerol--glycerol-3-phosphate 3-phosphatidyltransferase [Neisseria sp.]